jgi:hypothetical protein
MDDRLGVALCLEALAWIHAREHPSRSARLLGAADALWTLMATSLEAIPGLFPLRQDSEKSAREALRSELFTVSYAEGAGMDLDSAIAMRWRRRHRLIGPLIRSPAAGPLDSPSARTRSLSSWHPDSPTKRSRAGS